MLACGHALHLSRTRRRQPKVDPFAETGRQLRQHRKSYRSTFVPFDFISSTASDSITSALSIFPLPRMYPWEGLFHTPPKNTHNFFPKSKKSKNKLELKRLYEKPYANPDPESRRRSQKLKIPVYVRKEQSKRAGEYRSSMQPSVKTKNMQEGKTLKSTSMKKNPSKSNHGRSHRAEMQAQSIVRSNVED